MAPILAVFLQKFRKQNSGELDDSVEDENLREMSKSDFEKWIEKTPVVNLIWYFKAPLWVLAFYMLQIVIWAQFEPQWDWHQTVYFVSATLTSVGYGDISPMDDHGKIYCVVFMLIGFMTVTSVMTAWVDSMLRTIEALVIGTCTKRRTSDEVSEQETKNKTLVLGATNYVPINYAYAYRKILFSIGVIIVCQFIGVTYMMISHEWTFLNAIYWSTTTALSIGYGDPPVDHDHTTLLIVSAFMLMSTLCVAVALGNFVTVAQDIDREERKRRQINKLSVLDLLLEAKYGYVETAQGDFNAAPKRTRHKHLKAMAEDPKHEIHKTTISKLDFVLFIVEKIHGLRKEYDIDPILKKFDDLDTNGNGTLNLQDIFDLEEVLLQATEKRLQEKVAFNRLNIFDRIAVSMGYKRCDDDSGTVKQNLDVSRVTQVGPDLS